MKLPKIYNVTLRHDRGLVTIQASGDCVEDAIELVLKAELAPRSAVRIVKRVNWDGSLTPVMDYTP